ncbi:MAG: alpha/beta fold hydrolase [Alphaproteobacteria bacterium]|nr:alpha/beta fold hydrolase [Alphaproteobacteria bacterium]
MGIGRNADRVIDKFLWYSYANMSVFGGRDLVLIDNRGVGSSIPRLDCPEVEDVLLKMIQTSATESEKLVAYQDGFVECRRRLTETEGIDISKYNVVQAAHDLNALRRGLGFDSLNLYGVSYGSRVAMVYARQFPDATRALVLDSVDPPHIKIYEQAPRSDWRAFERVFEMCAENERCNARFGGDLQERFNTFLGNLDGRHIEWTMTNPRTLKPMQAKISGGVILTSLFLSMYVETSISNIPLIISSLMNDSFDYIGELVREEYVKAFSVRPFDEGAYASYNCYDEIPFNDASVAVREAGKYPIQKYMNRNAIKTDFAMCDIWNVPAGDPVEVAPVRSSIPTLLLSGALDPVTPPECAADSLQ